ncbi:hypothetical protein [Lactobacillus taiwanensis]|uniref:hypothetical protein n=1 Tax=Lactobacillus taiwanensis TaxID=508451 RepID=UPI0027315234|nr:hypothetical protein [Lactobacillus taiwanensis]
MSYNARIAKLHSEVFSTPKGSPEREQAILALSEPDKEEVFNLEMDYVKGRITRKEIMEMAQKETKSMTYEQFKAKMNDDYKGRLQELSKFAKESPELYKQHRERYQQEQDEERRLRNRRLTESTFKNKPYSFR